MQKWTVKLAETERSFDNKLDDQKGPNFTFAQPFTFNLLGRPLWSWLLIRTKDRFKENRTGKCERRTELNKSRTWTGPSIGLKNLEKNWTTDWTTGHTWSFRSEGPGNHGRACRSRGEISVKNFRGYRLVLFFPSRVRYVFIRMWWYSGLSQDYSRLSSQVIFRVI